MKKCSNISSDSYKKLLFTRDAKRVDEFVSIRTFFPFFSEIEILIRFKIFGDMRDIWQEVDEAVSSFHPTKNSLKVCCLS